MKKYYNILSLVLLPVLCAAQNKKFNASLTDSLAKWVVLDQTAAGPPSAWLKGLPKAQQDRYRDSVLLVNEIRIKSVFDRYGFPGYDLVGKTGSNNFWLIAQHCDKNVPFQKKVLKKMKAKLPSGNADPKNFAFLTDRVLINTGQKQSYGTQLTYNTDSCQAIPKPLKDSLNVNRRRAEIGLEPIEDYLNSMSEFHFQMNKAVYQNRGIQGPKLLPVAKH